MGGSDDTLTGSPRPHDADSDLTQTAQRRSVSRAVAQQVGRFEILERLGAGGIGVVYAARDPELGRKVALKFLLPSDRGDERLIREARAMAALSHPNVVPVFEIGRHEGEVYVAMEFVDGQTLRAWQSGRSVVEVLEAYMQAGRGLAAAHAHGIVHRDFKPDNVMVGQDGRPRVLDFGLARAAGGLDVTELAPEPNATTLTKTGAILGTPAYMAPEQFAGEDADERSDQFAFCVSLYEAIYGGRPFRAETVPSLARKVTRGEFVPPPARRDVPRRIRDALRRGLSLDRGDRFDSMDALLAGLAPRARGRLLLASTGGLAAVVALTVVLSASEDETLPNCRNPSALAEVWPRPLPDPALARYVDRFAAQWEGARSQICAAKPPGQGVLVSAAAHSCLEQHAAGLRETLGRIPRAEPALAEEVVRRLPQPRRCASPAVPLLEDATVKEAVELQFQLARVRVHSGRSEIEQALALSKQVVEQARRSSSATLQAQALIGLYWSHWFAGDVPASIETAKAAAILGRTRGRPLQQRDRIVDGGGDRRRLARRRGGQRLGHPGSGGQRACRPRLRDAGLGRVYPRQCRLCPATLPLQSNPYGTRCAAGRPSEGKTLLRSSRRSTISASRNWSPETTTARAGRSPKRPGSSSIDMAPKAPAFAIRWYHWPRSSWRRATSSWPSATPSEAWPWCTPTFRRAAENA